MLCCYCSPAIEDLRANFIVSLCLNYCALELEVEYVLGSSCKSMFAKVRYQLEKLLNR
jgi:hypothetical protein